MTVGSCVCGVPYVVLAGSLRDKDRGTPAPSPPQGVAVPEYLKTPCPPRQRARLNAHLIQQDTSVQRCYIVVLCSDTRVLRIRLVLCWLQQAYLSHKS